MPWLQDVLAQKDTLLRGVTLVLGGFALILVGTFIGLAEGKWMAVVAGTFAVTGIVVAFLGLFVYVIPPMLPAK